MKATFKTSTIIQGDVDCIWKLMEDEQFTKDFFPEIKKDTHGMSDYVQKTHKNLRSVQPDYTIPQRGMGWTQGAGTTIRLPLRGTHAKIESIDVSLQKHRDKTKINIEVSFNFKTALAYKSVRDLFKVKKNALKTYMDTSCTELNWTEQFGTTQPQH